MRSSTKVRLERQRESVAAGNDPRAKRAALSNPSPTTITFKSPELSNESAIKYSAHAGKDEKLDQGSTRAPARERGRRQRPEGEARSAE